jgi:transcription antitermination factor NusG
VSDYNGPSYYAKVRIMEPCGYGDLLPGAEVEAIIYPELEHCQIERVSQGKAARWWSIRKDAVQELERYGQPPQQPVKAEEPSKEGEIVRFKNGPFKGRTYRRNSRGQLELVSAERQLHRRKNA